MRNASIVSAEATTTANRIIFTKGNFLAGDVFREKISIFLEKHSNNAGKERKN